MSTVSVIWILLAAAVSAVCLTAGLRRYALARGVIDIPNQRSSHTDSTPRGGGAAIALTFLGGVAWLGAAGHLDPRIVGALFGPGVVVAGIGFLDDHRPVPAIWRLVAHACAATWALYALGGAPPVELWGRSVHLGWLGHVLAAMYLVWLINLYNFMDGIDGIAGLEAVTVGLGAGLLLWWTGAPAADWLLPALLTVSAFGFLVWNWPPARIFMGDVGSGFLGLMLGVLGLSAGAAHPDLFWCWLILLGVFVVDATCTLARRVRRREQLFEAHQQHAYQRLARRAGSHKPVTIAVGAINVFWLLPIAGLVMRGTIDGLAGLAIAYAPLLWIYVRLSAAPSATR
jgi:Fuc2NAc and GlcNAc transferase